MRVKRIRKRYLVFKVRGVCLKEQTVRTAIEQTLQTLHGYSGILRSFYTFVVFDEKRQAGIVSCHYGVVNLVRSSIALAPTIALKHHNVLMYTVKVTGTLKKAKKILCSIPSCNDTR